MQKSLHEKSAHNIRFYFSFFSFSTWYDFPGESTLFKLTHPLFLSQTLRKKKQNNETKTNSSRYAAVAYRCVSGCV